jgi:hypothetical protein
LWLIIRFIGWIDEREGAGVVQRPVKMIALPLFSANI